jgi:hypothetical protein
MSITGQATPILKNITLFIMQYAVSGVEDSRAVKDFRICESNEAVASLRSELQAVSNSIAPDHTLDKILGKKRALQHGSYEKWAKAMLVWLAQPSN